MTNYLVLDDDAIDRKVMADAVTLLGGTPMTAGTFYEARNHLRRTEFQYCLFDFYLDRDKSLTVAKFIAEVRNDYPCLPIIIASNASDPAHIRPCLLAGADVFVPKIPKKTEFSRPLEIASMAASIQRDIQLQSQRLPREALHQFRDARTQKSVDLALTDLSKSILLSGESGTGKTTLARSIAMELIKSFPERFKQGYHLVNCAEYDEAALQKIFFESSERLGNGLVNAFERSQNGILILDNIHTLPKTLQRELRKHFERGFLRPRGSIAEVLFRNSRVICTCLKSEETNLLKAFVAALNGQKIMLPSVRDLYEKSDLLIKSILEKGNAEKKFLKMNVDTEFTESVSRICQFSRLPANFASLQNIIFEAVNVAVSQNRNTLFAVDLPNIVEPGEPAREAITSDLDLGLKRLMSLIADGEDYKQAKKLLRHLMIVSAIQKNEKDAATICANLGISRALLYKYGYKKSKAVEPKTGVA